MLEGSGSEPMKYLIRIRNPGSGEQTSQYRNIPQLVANIDQQYSRNICPTDIKFSKLFIL